MLLDSQLQIGLVVLTGLVLGSIVLIALVWADKLQSDNRSASLASALPPPLDDQVVFLFSERSLIQMTDAGAAFLDRLDNSDRDKDGDQDDWTRVLQVFRPRFASLPDHSSQTQQSGQLILTASAPDDTGQLVIDWWDGHTRITLIDPMKSDRIHAPGLQDEADWLRQAVTGAPYPIWQSDPHGRVVWANAAYLDLVKRFKADNQDVSETSSLFDTPLQSTDGIASFRVSVTPVGAMNPYWFDIRSLKLDTGWMNYATDVNAVVNAEIAQRNFVQTLTKTFAQLSIGLAIFDRKRQLALFNPALIDLTTLPAEFLSARPNLLSFFDRLRDRNMMPEPKNYRSWRDQISDLVAAADSGQYRETWTLPSGLTYRISGRPHPDGAVAFLFEDISAEISSTRRFRSQLELGQSALNTLDQSIAVFSASGLLAFSNTAYRQMWGIDPDSSFADISVNDASRHWQAGSLPTPVWGDLRDFVVQFGERSEWSADITLNDGQLVNCHVIPMPGGTTLVTFQIDDSCQIATMDNDLRSTA